MLDIRYSSILNMSGDIIYLGGFQNMEYIINLTWDNEACVWIATSADIPGLVLESGSFDALLERTRIAIPELLTLNASSKPLSISFVSERHERITV